MKLSELMNMSARQINELSDTELRKAYQQTKYTLKSRAVTFEKHGINVAHGTYGRPSSALLPSSKGMDIEEQRQRLKTSLAYMRGRGSTYKGYKQIEDERRRRLQESMPDLDLSSKEKVDKFGRFIGEMQTRWGEMWKYVSNSARDIYREAMRLNADPRMFMKNYDFWADHIQDLEEAQPIRQRAGSRGLRPADYARKLKLGKIRG